MAGIEPKLELVKRHVREGERLVIRQRAIISRLMEMGCPTTIADELLIEFETSLRQHRDHLARLMKRA
jgi:hypothetical protein